MEVENTPQSGALSMDEAVAALRQSRQDQAKGEEQPTDEAEAQPEAEVTEAPEATPDEPEAEHDAEAEPQDDDDGALYEVAGETFTLAELREWKKGALRQADYTRKTQEVAEARKATEAERQSFEMERQQVAEKLRAEQKQLQDALATFAIEQDPEPDPARFPQWSDYVRARSAWDQKQQKKSKAAQAYQALQAQQHEEVLRGEIGQLFRARPEWREPEAFTQNMQSLADVAKTYGFTDSDVASIVDHRMFLLLDDLRQAKGTADTVRAGMTAANKKVVQAVKKLQPGAKPDPKNQVSKAVADTRDRLRKTGSVEDAVALLQARRRAQG